MHPVFCKRLAVGRLRLGNLVFMMGENQILPACMDVDFLSKIPPAHHRALNVPARPAIAPGGLPVRLSFLFRLPEHKIKRVFLLVLPAHQKRTVPPL